MHNNRLKDPQFRPVLVSLSVSLLMLVGKVLAYIITDSTAIFSDAAESVIHVLATALVAATIWYALKPADESHLYGHGKATYFSTGFEGGLIFIAAAVIIYSAITDLIHGPQLHQLGRGLILLGGLTALNLILGMYLIRSGRKYNNSALVSNGQHVLTDMWTSLGVLVGIGLVWLTGILWFDPLVAILVALNILKTAFQLLKTAFSGLMETSDARDTRAILNQLDEAVVENVIAGYHQLRYRIIGDRRWVEYHLLFPDGETLQGAHERSHEVEERISKLFPKDEVVVTAHLEPIEHDLAHPRGHVEPDDPLDRLTTERNG
ncbi:MAG: cation diffusion facilitator family transporter [Bacteroidota bacterium]